MRSKQNWILGLVVGVFVALIPITLSGISLEEKTQLQRYGVSTLKGLSGVCPKVNLFPREGVKLHLVNQNTLQTEVELELRKAGIIVFDDANDINAGLFTITITIDKVEQLPLYCIGATVSLSQYAGLLRDPKILTYVPTWPLFPSPITYCVGEGILEEHLNDLAADNMKKFINDYLAANPKEQQTKKNSVEQP